MKEQWRVVLESGEVREVAVSLEEHGWSARTPCDRAVTRHRSADVAVRRLVSTYIDVTFNVREICAPGEPTRAELVAQRDAARREGAQAMREAAAKLAATRCAALHLALEARRG